MRLGLRRRPRVWLNWTILAAVLVVVGSWSLDFLASPVLGQVADWAGRRVATDALNRAVLEKVGTGLRYEDLIHVRTDKDGHISMLQPDTIAIARLAAQAGTAIQQEFDHISGVRYDVPLYQVLGNQLFAGSGPRIPVRFLPLTTVQVNVKQQFNEAGINQTRHVIYLEVAVTVQVAMPLFTRTQNLHSELPLSEAVIVGQVPNTYWKHDLGTYRADGGALPPLFPPPAAPGQPSTP